MSNIHFIYGEENYLADYAIQKLTGGDVETMVVSSVDEDAVMWLNTFSLSLSEKLLILEVKELGADEQLLKVLSSGQLDSGFAVKAEKAKSNTKLFKWLTQNATVTKCDRLNEKLFDKFLRRKNGTVDLHISEENLSYLKERLDYQSGRISLAEIDILMQMLSLFDEVTKTDIDTYVSVSAERKAFDIVDFLARKEFGAAVRAAGEYDDSGIAAVSAMLWSFRLALSVKIFSREESGATPFQLRGVLPFLDYSEETLIKVFAELNRSLKRMKSGMPEKPCFVATVGLLADYLLTTPA